MVDGSEDGLPGLTGSPRQIRWAQHIRATQLDPDIASYIRWVTRRARAEHAAIVWEELPPVLREVAWRQTRAAWWIDHRVHEVVPRVPGFPSAGSVPTCGLGYAANDAMTASDIDRYQAGVRMKLALLGDSAPRS